MSPTPQDWEAAGFRSDGFSDQWDWGDDDEHRAYICTGLFGNYWWVGGGDGSETIGGEFDLDFRTEQEAFDAAVWLAAVARQRDEEET